MTIPRWPLAGVTATLIVLSAIGGGLVQTSTSHPAPAGASNTVSQAVGTPPAGNTSDQAPFVGKRLRALRGYVSVGDLGRLRKDLVHGTVTVLDRDGKLIALQLDHGTIASISDGSITMSEAGGSTITVATNADTRVREDGAPSALAALAVGNEVIVVSVLTDGWATARGILVPASPPAPTATPSGAAS